MFDWARAAGPQPATCLAAPQSDSETVGGCPAREGVTSIFLGL